MKNSEPNILFLFPGQWCGDWLENTNELLLKILDLNKLRARGMTPSPLYAPSRVALALERKFDYCGAIKNNQAMPV